MKFTVARRNFRRAACALILVPGAGALAGCVSASFEDAVPRGALNEPAPARPAPVRADDYPNLNLPPQSAAEQIGDAERQALHDDLTAAKGRAGATPQTGDTAADMRRLRRLAREHGERRRKVIEAGE